MTVNQQNHSISITVLAGGIFYYTGVLLFGLSHLESNFIMDGFSHVYTIASWETFAPTMGRHVLILHQLVPVIAANMGASTRGIMEAYVAGDTLLYFSVFLLLLCVLKDRWAALLAISVHVFGMFYNHFMMVGELHPGSMFAILTLSVVVNWQGLSEPKRLLLYPAAFFTVSSHPLALASFLTMLWLWRVSSSPKIGLGNMKSAALTMVMLILKWLMLDDYDVSTVTSNIRPLSEAIMVMFNPSYLLNFSLFFLFTSPVAAIGLLFALLHLLNGGKHLTVALLLLFQLGWAILVQQYLDFTYFSLDFIQSMMHDRYLFPIRFVALGCLFLMVLPKLEHGEASDGISLYVMAVWLLGLPFLAFSAKKADRTIAEFKNTIHESRKQGITKAYYPVEDYCDDVYIHRGSFFATLVLSNLDHLEPVHVVHASTSMIDRLDFLNEGEVLLMAGVIADVEKLPSDRMSFPTGKYQPLKYTCK